MNVKEIEKPVKNRKEELIDDKISDIEEEIQRIDGKNKTLSSVKNEREEEIIEPLRIIPNNIISKNKNGNQNGDQNRNQDVNHNENYHEDNKGNQNIGKNYNIKNNTILREIPKINLESESDSSSMDDKSNKSKLQEPLNEEIEIIEKGEILEKTPENFESNLSNKKLVDKSVNIISNEFKQSNGDFEQVIKSNYDKLNEIEKDILSVAEEVLKKRKLDAIINIEKSKFINPIVRDLIELSYAKFHNFKEYSKEQILKTINQLEKKYWIVTGHRRTKLELTQSESLTNVYALIHTNPGIHSRHEKIESEIGISKTSFLKSALVLKSFGLIRYTKFGKRKCFFSNLTPDIFDDLVILLKNPLNIAIIKYIKLEEHSTLAEISKDLDLLKSTVLYNLNKLVNSGLLVKIENEYYVSNELLKRYNKIFKTPDFTNND